MADDLDAFAGPRGPLPQWDSELPTVEADAGRVIDLMTAALMADQVSDGFYVVAACGGHDGCWRPVVIIELGDIRWFVSAVTGRQIADLIAGSRIAFDDPEGVAAHIRRTADQAEALAAGQRPSTPRGATLQ